MKRKFTLCLVTMLCLFANRQVFCQSEAVFPVSLDAADWDASLKGTGADLYNEDKALVLDIMSNANPPWQGIVFYVINLDLDVYPNARVSTAAESTAQWSLKLFAAGMADQVNPFGKDQTTYGVKTFAVGDVTGQTGVSSFELWLWGIGVGQRVIFNKMEFYGEGVAGIKNPQSNPCIFHVEKGRLIFDSYSGKSVTIYTIDGKLVKQINSTQISSVDLAKGLYIIKAGTTALKAMVP